MSMNPSHWTDPYDACGLTRHWLHEITAPAEGIVIIADPGHAWAQVPRFVVEDLDLIVSQYSYQNPEYFWLEEDCDLFNFVKEVEAQLQTKLTHNDFTEVYVDDRDVFFRSVGAQQGGTYDAQT